MLRLSWIWNRMTLTASCWLKQVTVQPVLREEQIDYLLIREMAKQSQGKGQIQNVINWNHQCNRPNIVFLLLSSSSE